MSNVGHQCAAIVCGHVAKAQAPVLLAQRDLPEDPADSGWQFLCGADEEDWTEARVWSVGEVLEIVPDFAEFLERPAGSALVRVNASSPWAEASDQ